MQPDKEKIRDACAAGMTYLRKQVHSGRYGLACLGNDGKPKFSNERGHLFSVFHLVNAFKGEMTEVERTMFLMRIFSEEYNGQWGYSPRGYYKETGENPFFTDADDTSFALRSLRLMDVYRPNDILLKYRSDIVYNGNKFPGFVTFISGDGYRGIATGKSFADNFQVHPEVNANVYHTLLDSLHDDLISEELISRSQRDDGSWRSFFYPNPFYATYQFLSLLSRTAILSNCFQKGIQYLITDQNTDGSWGEKGDIHFSALALKSLCLDMKAKDFIAKGVSYILDQMDQDGSWKTNAVIWEFHDNDGDIWRAYDSNRIIATSQCVEVLKTFLEIIE